MSAETAGLCRLVAPLWRVAEIGDGKQILLFWPFGSLKRRSESLGRGWVERMSTLPGSEGKANIERTVRTFSKLWSRSQAVLRRHVYLIANAFSLALTLNICGHVWTLTPVPLHVCVVKLQRTHKDIFPVRPSFVLRISWQQTLSKSYYQATAFQRLHDETFVRTGGADIQRAVTHRK